MFDFGEKTLQFKVFSFVTHQISEEWSEDVDRRNEIDFIYLYFTKDSGSVPRLEVLNILENY